MSDKNMLDVVRIKTPAGVERNATRAEAKRTGAQVINKPTHDGRGRPAPDVVPEPAAEPTVSEKSTHEQIDSFAAEHGIDLTGATTKNDKLAAIAANTEEA